VRPAEYDEPARRSMRPSPLTSSTCGQSDETNRGSACNQRDIILSNIAGSTSPCLPRPVSRRGGSSLGTAQRDADEHRPTMSMMTMMKMAMKTTTKTMMSLLQLPRR